MRAEDYKPFYLSDIVEVNDCYYILNGGPQNYNEDLYYEIHIESDSTLRIIKDYIDSWIYVDLISSSKLEIYTGEYESERCSDGPMTYTNYSYKEIEKTSKAEWEPKVKDLKDKFYTLLNDRLPLYVLTRDKVVHNYQRLYKEMLADISNGIDKACLSLFGSLYGIFGPNLVSDYYLHTLVNKDKEFIKELTFFKDWELEYLHWETKYNNLLKIDLEDYPTIKNHVIDIYKKTFNHMLPNVKYQFKDVDEQKYTALFDSIINRLYETEA